MDGSIKLTARERKMLLKTCRYGSDVPRARRAHVLLARWGHRVELHFLPAYSPDTNPIERVWWHLHETVTRNHRRESIDELLDDAFTWFNQQPNYQHEIANLYRTAA